MADLLKKSSVLPHVLTIAGSDSGGGAGIQADLKTISAFGCYGSSVITALTAQNTLGVQAVHNVPADFVVQQLKSIFDDAMRPDAIKFGMLAGEPVIAALQEFFLALPAEERPYLVLDPVMISTSGHALLPNDANKPLIERLLPLVDLVTPNIPEARAIVTPADAPADVTSLQDMVALANALRKANPQIAVLLKGGHLPLARAEVASAAKQSGYTVVWDEGSGDADDNDVAILEHFKTTILGMTASPEVVVDILVDDAGVRMFVGNKIDSSSTHGTGCTLSAALASAYAIDKLNGRISPTERTLHTDTVRSAISYVQGAIAAAFPLGRGHGPLNHGYLTTKRALPAPSPHNPTPFMSHLLRADPTLWREYVRHPFVAQLGAGTLPLASFQHYIIQDWHYLRHYARAHALGAYKATDFPTIEAFSAIQLHIAKESKMHETFCEQFGVSRQQLADAPEAAACSAYARYMLDVGAQGDVLDVYVAVFSCLVGYGEVGLWLASRVQSGETVMEGNPYRRWIEDYSGPEFLAACNRGVENLERRIAADPPTPARLEKLTKIWIECVRLERNFWEMGLKVQG